MTANHLLADAMEPGPYRGPTTPECPECEGRGASIRPIGHGSGVTAYVCPECKGTGRVRP